MIEGSHEQDLLEDLGRLADRGARGPEDVLEAAPHLLALVTAPGGRWARATAVYRLLHAATQALGHPRGTALRELLALNPVPPGRVPLTKTERREKASEHYRVEGDSFRKTHEKKLLQALAMEIDRRLRSGNDTTHGKPKGWVPFVPPAPPPPADTFRPVSQPPSRPRPDGK